MKKEMVLTRNRTNRLIGFMAEVYDNEGEIVIRIPLGNVSSARGLIKTLNTM